MTHPLISASDLRDRIDDPNLVLVDCRWYLGEPGAGRAAYRQGHLPGAVYADLDHDLSGPPSVVTGGGRHPLPAPDSFDATLARLGIGTRSHVVAYDDRGGAVAARLWWMLTDQGHGNTQILDGGIDAWVEDGGSLETGEAPIASSGEGGNVATRGWRGVVTITDVEAAQNGIFDARAPERYRGDMEPVDPKAGHIPGARNLPLTDHLHHGRFRPAGDIDASLDLAGMAADSIVHCGSGVTACHLILAAAVAGRPRPQLYVGSWSEWAASDRPVSTGDGA